MICFDIGSTSLCSGVRNRFDVQQIVWNVGGGLFGIVLIFVVAVFCISRCDVVSGKGIKKCGDNGVLTGCQSRNAKQLLFQNIRHPGILHKF